MATATGSGQNAAFERAFASKNYKFGDAVLVVRAQQLAQQLHMTPEAFANQYDSYALISDWNGMDVTAQRLKAVADYLEGEQRKENARPRAAAAGGVAIKGLPQAMRPTWEDLPDKLDYPTPSAKRQALDPTALNPGTGSKPGIGTATKAPAAPGSSQRGAVAAAPAMTAAGTPQPAGQQQRATQQQLGYAATPGRAAGAAAAGTPSAPPSAFAQRSNRGQVVAVLHDHLPGPAAYSQQQQHRAGAGSGAGVAVRPVGQPALDGDNHLFMMEVLETKVHALDERIMDFADALTAATRGVATRGVATRGVATTPGPAAGTPGPTPGGTATPVGGGGPSAHAMAGTRTPPPPMAGGAATGGMTTPVLTPGVAAAAQATPVAAGVGAGGGGEAAAAALFEAAEGAQPLQHGVADISQLPVWVAGRVLAEAEGAPLNAESLILEGCREASNGARVRLDVSCLKGYRLFSGQSVCAYGLNPLGPKFIAQRLVTHVPPPLSTAAAGALGSVGADAAAAVAAAREAGLSLVVAAGPYCLTEDLSYSPLEELLSYCTAHPPDVLMLLGPFVDSEHPGLASGAADRTADAVLREEVLQRLAAWRSTHPSATLALMPAVRDVTAVPVLPQPALTAAAQAVGPADKAVALQNPATVSMGPLVVAAGSSDLLKALSAAELSRVPAGIAVERLPALASHVLGQRSLYPLYPAPPGTCLDTSHYSQLQLPVAPDLLLLPSDLAPFAKVLPPSAWAEGAPPGLLQQQQSGAAGAAGSAASSSAAPVVVVNPGRVSRGGSGGTFAHVVVTPGSAPLLERIRVEVKRV